LAFWREASEAYRHFLGLGGSHIDDGDRVIAFDLPQAISQAADICHFIIETNNHRQIDLISTNAVAISDGNRTLHAQADLLSGAISYPILRFDDGEDHPLWQGAILEHGSELDEQLGNDTGTYGFVTLRGVAYLVLWAGGAPMIVSQPMPDSDHPDARVCTFKRSFASVVVEDHEPSLCKPFLDRQMTEVPFNGVSSRDEIKPMKPEDMRVGAQTGYFDGVANISLGDGKISRAGHFATEGGTSSGAVYVGVTLLDGNAVYKGEPNTSLLELQLDSYAYTDASLLEMNGKTYVQVLGPKSHDSDDRPRNLLELADGKFRLACRVLERVMIEPPLAQQ
jgi:hypothetical protein